MLVLSSFFNGKFGIIKLSFSHVVKHGIRIEAYCQAPGLLKRGIMPVPKQNETFCLGVDIGYVAGVIPPHTRFKKFYILLRRLMYPKPARPAPRRIQVEGSGTAEVGEFTDMVVEK